jgi:hypothetical protein
VLLSVSGLLSIDLAAQSESTLKYKAMPTFDLVLPEETWSNGSGGIAIAHQGGDRFDTDVEKMTLRIDSDGDGKLDVTAKGTSGYAVLNAKRADGSALTYGLRFRNNGAVCQYASSGAMVGAIEGVPIQLVDQNNNGVFNEVGVDAIVVGQRRAASFLSKVVNLKGKLFELEVNALGTQAKTKPYAGASGTLSLRRGLKLLGDLHSAVVSDESKTLSFEVSSAADGIRVPAGKMKPLVVSDGGTTTMQWGAPLMAEFNYTRDGEEITVQPQVMFLGRGGEQWHTLLPDAKSPKLMFFDKDSDKLIATKRFEGC